ncbi:MAG TPA: YciI family protein [Candidatus Binatia bacterium]
MKFLCLSYWDEKKFDLMSESERETFVKECFAYDNVLRKDGHFLRLEALQSARSAKTLRHYSGKVSMTDGPYAETKEQLGGILLLDADDLNHAAELMSKHPGIRVAAFEIRPLDEDATASVNTTENL